MITGDALDPALFGLETDATILLDIAVEMGMQCTIKALDSEVSGVFLSYM